MLRGWEYGVDGCINNAVLPGNQTRCSGVLCRILKRYLFVRRCHPPPPAPLRSPLISSLLPPPLPQHTNTHPPTSTSIQHQCMDPCVSPFTDVYCTYCERARGTAALLSYCYNQDDALSASSELASLLLILFFQRAMQQGRCCGSEDEPRNERLLLCTRRWTA